MFRHELQLRDIFGEPFSFSLAYFAALFRTWQGLGFFIVICAGLIITDPNVIRPDLSFQASVVFYILGPLFYLLIVYAMFFAVVFVDMAYGPFNIYVPIITGPSFVFGFASLEYAAHLASDGKHMPLIYPTVVWLVCVALLFESIYIRAIMPRVFPHMAKPTPPPPVTTADAPAPPADPPPVDIPPALPFISVGNRNIRLDKIIYMNSQEHYVQIVMPSETLMHRAKIRDLIADLSACHGIQPHRSWWVPSHAKPIMVKKPKPALQLHEGTVVPIARARVQDVQDWIDLHGDW